LEIKLADADTEIWNAGFIQCECKKQQNNLQILARWYIVYFIHRTARLATSLVDGMVDIKPATLITI
jgi:hypothetical protein